MAKLQFLGATGTVTGSKYLLEVGGSRALIDCGLFQGLKELRQRNWEPLPIDARSISWVFLTHAHIDHTGYLPRLVRDGFTGPAYATEATADLLGLLLPDSGKIQEEDAQYANKKGYSKHKPALPLYTEKDARVALKQVQKVPYLRTQKVSKFLSITFIPAGHILGSSFVLAEITEPGREPVKVLLSGDVGRYDEPILNDPSQVDGADYVLVESTYGNRLHGGGDPKDELSRVVNDGVERGGKIIIPAFAIGRTQLLIYYLRELEDEGRIPVLPVAVDSPMAASATKMYRKHASDHDLDMVRLKNLGKNPLATRNFTLVSGRGASKALGQQTGPGIIISASGMATGGRVLHHLAQHLPDPNATVILVGYQATGTRGRRLQEGETEMKIHGQIVPVRAKVETISSMSAHADSSELMRWLSGFKEPPRTTYLVHGEPDSAEALRDKIARELGWNAVVPVYKEEVDI